MRTIASAAFLILFMGLPPISVAPKFLRSEEKLYTQSVFCVNVRICVKANMEIAFIRSVLEKELSFGNGINKKSGGDHPRKGH